MLYWLTRLYGSSKAWNYKRRHDHFKLICHSAVMVHGSPRADRRMLCISSDRFDVLHLVKAVFGSWPRFALRNVVQAKRTLAASYNVLVTVTPNSQSTRRVGLLSMGTKREMVQL
jgi:hypothetical protein